MCKTEEGKLQALVKARSRSAEIIRAAESRHETGNIVSHVSVEAISVVAARAHAHWLRRTPSAQMDDQPRQRAHWRELPGKPHRISALGAERRRFRFLSKEHLSVSDKAPCKDYAPPPRPRKL